MAEAAPGGGPLLFVPGPSWRWEPAGPVLIGRLDLEGARAAMAD